MKVLILSNASSVHTVRVANGLASRGLDVHVASIHDFSTDFHPSITKHAAPLRGRVGYILNAPWLHMLCRRLKPDVINAHYLSGYGTLATLALVRPLIVTSWGSDICAFPEKSWLHRALIKLVLNRAEHTSSVSHATKSKHDALSTAPCTVIPFGVDMGLMDMPNADPASKTPFTKGDFIMGICKHLYSFYGQEEAIQVVATLKKQFPDRPIRLVLVGDGPDQARFEAFAEKLGVRADVHFAGQVSHLEIPYYHNILSAYLVASQNEGLCVSALEAGAAAKPVVANRVGELPSIIRDGWNGFLVTPFKDNEMAEAVAKLVADPALAATMGQNARAYVQDKYDWQKNIGQMVTLFSDVATQDKKAA